MSRLQVLLLIFVGASMSSNSSASDQIMVKEIVVSAPVSVVWDAWTTADGLTFVSEKSNVDIRRGGPYELFLDGDVAENGKRGSEGAKVLAFVPNKMLAFSWTFPPVLPELRNNDEMTQVVIFFSELGPSSTQVSMYVHEWQSGQTWKAGWDYFDEAWSYVLDRLQQKYAVSDRSF